MSKSFVLLSTILTLVHSTGLIILTSSGWELPLPYRKSWAFLVAALVFLIFSCMSLNNCCWANSLSLAASLLIAKAIRPTTSNTKTIKKIGFIVRGPVGGADFAFSAGRPHFGHAVARRDMLAPQSGQSMSLGCCSDTVVDLDGIRK